MKSISHYLALAILIAPLSAVATPVTIDGKEWRQVTDTTGYSWNEIASVCDPTTGVCSDTLLGGVLNLDRWLWADTTEVAALYASLTSHPGGLAYYTEADSGWAPAFFDVFAPTNDFDGGQALMAFTRSLVPMSNGLILAQMTRVADLDDPLGLDDVCTTCNTMRPQNSSWAIGSWFYRSVVVSAPEPASTILFGLGLAGIGVIRRKRPTIR